MLEQEQLRKEYGEVLRRLALIETCKKQPGWKEFVKEIELWHEGFIRVLATKAEPVDLYRAQGKNALFQQFRTMEKYFNDRKKALEKLISESANV